MSGLQLPRELKGVTCSIEWVAPEVAAEWLAKLNTRNRSFKKRTLDTVTRALLDGDWVFNGATISFGKDGQLIDGQNRLKAIVDTGVGIWTLVVRGVPNAHRAQMTVDGGVARSFGDQLAILKVANANDVAAAVRTVFNWEETTHTVAYASRKQPTLLELEACLARHPRITETVAATPSKVKALTTRSFLAAHYYLFSLADEEDADEFVRLFVSGDQLAEIDPIAQLRAIIFRELARGGSGIHTYQRAGLLLKAWGYWRRGEQVRRLAFSPGGSRKEKFPLIDGLAHLDTPVKRRDAVALTGDES